MLLRFYAPLAGSQTRRAADHGQPSLVSRVLWCLAIAQPLAGRPTVNRGLASERRHRRILCHAGVQAEEGSIPSLWRRRRTMSAEGRL